MSKGRESEFQLALERRTYPVTAILPLIQRRLALTSLILYGAFMVTVVHQMAVSDLVF